MTKLILLVVLARAPWADQRWGTQEEMARVGRNVVDHERLTGQLPAGADWLGWLDARYPSEETSTDPWGTPYQLVVWADSVGIVSFGPDRTRGTRDDFTVVSPRK